MGLAMVHGAPIAHSPSIQLDYFEIFWPLRGNWIILKLFRNNRSGPSATPTGSRAPSLRSPRGLRRSSGRTRACGCRSRSAARSRARSATRRAPRPRRRCSAPRAAAGRPSTRARPSTEGSASRRRTTSEGVLVGPRAREWSWSSWVVHWGDAVSRVVVSSASRRSFLLFRVAMELFEYAVPCKPLLPRRPRGERSPRNCVHDRGVFRK